MELEGAISHLHKAHQAGQEKYTYFLLAAAGAAIGFAVQKTEGVKLSWWLLPVALATVSWAASFVFGCKTVEWVHAAISAIMALLQLRNGSHPQQPPHPQLVGAAIEGVNSGIAKNIGKAFFYGIWQFRFLTLGAVFFIGWRIAEMVRIS
jgi:hypothetical protein